MSLPLLLTTRELAEYLRTPVRTLEYWRARAYGPPFVYVGKRAMYREDDVLAWLEALPRNGR